jgi:hypothetical protein
MPLRLALAVFALAPLLILPRVAAAQPAPRRGAEPADAAVAEHYSRGECQDRQGGAGGATTVAAREVCMAFGRGDGRHHFTFGFAGCRPRVKCAADALQHRMMLPN